MTHSMEFAFDGSLCLKVVCEEPDHAACRSVSDCNCENYSVEEDEQGFYHPAYDADLDEDVAHRHHLVKGYCNYAEWLNNSDCLDEDYTAMSKKIPLAKLPIKLDWNGDYYEWSIKTDE